MSHQDSPYVQARARLEPNGYWRVCREVDLLTYEVDRVPVILIEKHVYETMGLHDAAVMLARRVAG